MANIEHCTCDFYRITPKAVHREHAPDCPLHDDRIREREGESEEDRLRRQLEGAVEALEAADKLAKAVVAWKSHVTLEGLTGEYRAARNAAGGQ